MEQVTIETEVRERAAAKGYGLICIKVVDKADEPDGATRLLLIDPVTEVGYVHVAVGAWGEMLGHVEQARPLGNAQDRIAQAMAGLKAEAARRAHA